MGYLADKWRPKELDDVVGNKEVVKSLKTIVEAEDQKIPHAILFAGPHGCGKTTLGRIIGNILGCTPCDEVHHYDTAHFRGIEMVREIRRQMRYAPKKGEARLWILDEVHKMTNDAQNALLTALEEPPKHVYFVLCTTEPHKLLPTVQSRCATWVVEPVGQKLLTRHMKRICKGEGAEVPLDVLNQIADDSRGHVRDALRTLEQIMHLDENEMADTAKKFILQKTQSIELCRALIKRKPWKEVTKILNDLRKEEPESIRRQVLGYCDTVLSKEDNANAFLVMSAFADRPTYDIGFHALRLAAYDAMMEE